MGQWQGWSGGGAAVGWGSIRRLVRNSQPTRPLTCHRPLLLLLPLLPRAEERPNGQGAQHRLPPLGNLSGDLGRLRKRLCGQVPNVSCAWGNNQEVGGDGCGWLGDCGSATRPAAQAWDQAPTCSPCICLPPSTCRHSRCTAGQPASGLGAAGNCRSGINDASTGSAAEAWCRLESGRRRQQRRQISSATGCACNLHTTSSPRLLLRWGLGAPERLPGTPRRRQGALLLFRRSHRPADQTEWALRASDRELERYSRDPLATLATGRPQLLLDGVEEACVCFSNRREHKGENIWAEDAPPLGGRAAGSGSGERNAARRARH